MVLFSPFWSVIKMGDHWTLKNLVNNLLHNIRDEQFTFFHCELPSFHPLCDFVAVTSFILFF